MSRSFVSSAIVIIGATFVAPAFGAEPSPPIDTAVIPAAAPTSATPPVDKVTTSETEETAPMTAPGFNFAIGGSLNMPLGDAMKNVALGDITSSGVGVDARVSYYLSRHVGLFAGAGVNTARKDACDECSGLAYRVPVGFEYAFDDRVRGFFVNGGLDTFNGISSSMPGVGTVSFRGHMREGFAGAGYRLLVPRRNLGATFYFSGMLGEYDHAKASDIPDVLAVSRDLPTGQRSLHYGFLFAATVHFGM